MASDFSVAWQSLKEKSFFFTDQTPGPTMYTFKIIYTKLYLPNYTYQTISSKLYIHTKLYNHTIHTKLYIPNYTFQTIHTKLYLGDQEKSLTAPRIWWSSPIYSG
jgi:hypothetical protein